MKPELLSQQHIALKMGIFIIGIASAFEVNIRQLACQSALFLFFMLLDKSLYRKLLFALRKLLLFFTGYWIFATLFKLDFLQALLFSGRILYLLFVMVFCWGAVDKKMLLSQSRYYLRNRFGKSLISFGLNTFYFLQEYLKSFRQLSSSEELSSLIDNAVQAGREVHLQSKAIAAKVEATIAAADLESQHNTLANTLGLGFICILVILSNI